MADAVSLSFSPSYVVQRNRRVKKKNVPLHRRAEFRRHTLTVFATNLAEKKEEENKKVLSHLLFAKREKKEERGRRQNPTNWRADYDPPGVRSARLFAIYI